MALHPWQWKLWRERKVVIGYVLTVDFVALALAAAILLAMQIRSGDLVCFGLLVASAALTLFGPWLAGHATWLHPWMPYLCSVRA